MWSRIRGLISGGVRLLWVGGLLLGLGGLVLWMSGFFAAKIQPEWSDRVQRSTANRPTDEVHEVIKPVLEEVVGTLRAASRTVVSAKIMATIAEIPVVAGQEVRRGEVLVRLDAQEYQRRWEQAQQSVLAAISAEELWLIRKNLQHGSGSIFRGVATASLPSNEVSYLRVL